MQLSADASLTTIQQVMLSGWSKYPAENGIALGQEVELATIILDRLGKILFCNATAARLFCARTQQLLGLDIRALMPNLPLRPVTPGYNLAYATFWAAEGGWRQFNGRDSGRRVFRLEAALDKYELASRRQILLSLRPVRESAPMQLQWQFCGRRMPARNTACIA